MENMGWIQMELGGSELVRGCGVRVNVVPTMMLGAIALNSLAFLPTPVQAERISDSAYLTERQVYTFRREYAFGQSAKAMYSKLGLPYETRGSRDVWRIQRIGIDGAPTGEYGEFVAEYDAGDRARLWHAEW